MKEYILNTWTLLNSPPHLIFQVALFQLSEVSLVVSVYSRRSSMKARERVGWVSLGLNSTGEEQQVHWSQMKEAGGQQVCHWHTLLDS